MTGCTSVYLFLKGKGDARHTPCQNAPGASLSGFPLFLEAYGQHLTGKINKCLSSLLYAISVFVCLFTGTLFADYWYPFHRVLECTLSSSTTKFTGKFATNLRIFLILINFNKALNFFVWL